MSDEDLPEKRELSEEEANMSPSEFDPDRYMRIRVNANVNGVIRRGDRLTVEREHPFYAGLLKQKLVEEIS